MQFRHRSTLSIHSFLCEGWSDFWKDDLGLLEAKTTPKQPAETSSGLTITPRELYFDSGKIETITQGAIP